MPLPFLPGSSHTKQRGKEGFHKSQHFDYSNGIPMLVGFQKAGLGRELLHGQKIQPKYGLPTWLAFDKQALCFEAYFKEAVSEARQETYRIRQCKIYFYLEDETIKVVESASKNSGLPQGTLIRRQRIPLPPPDDDQFYNIFHFNINQQVVLYSRTFTLTSSDSFTRNFLTRLGVCLNEPATVPDDPYSKLREQIEKNMKPLRPYERYDTLKQFLDQDCRVLRFYCFWDDSESQADDLRELVLHYFLSDDSIEILEVSSPNSGRDAASKFLRRGKLPKRPSGQLKQPGEITHRTVLNVFTSSRQENHFILDSLKTGAVKEEFYKDCDLTVGGEVNVWGRKVIIADCDDFTKDYYRSTYGIENFTPVRYKAPAAPKPFRIVPPYNGFGSEEDSLSSCQGLLQKTPQKEFRKFMEKDRCGLESNVLNFRAKMVTTDPIDRDRLFIISFYLCDDSISVFECQQRNSGLLGGKFLQRSHVKKPGQELFKSQPSEFFSAQDLYVGATLSLNNHPFLLVDADEYTFTYMKQHAEEFPKANVGNILSKLRSAPAEKQSEMKKFLALSDPSSSGFISYESLRSLLMGLDCGLSEHEVLELGRCFSEREQTGVDVGLMLAVAQEFLRKKQFEDFSDMTRAFLHEDRHKSGRLSTREMRRICKAFQLPLSENLLQGLLSKFADGMRVDYHAFLAGINWLEQRALPVLPEEALQFDMNLRFGAGGSTVVKSINYSSLLGEIFSSCDPPTTTSTQKQS